MTAQVGSFPRDILDAVIEQALPKRARKWRVLLTVIDGTGMESRHVCR